MSTLRGGAAEAPDLEVVFAAPQRKDTLDHSCHPLVD